MDPRLQTLLNNSASISKVLPDQQLLMQLWLNAQFFGIPSDWTTLSNIPSGFKFLSPSELLAIELYAIANKLGLPTDGAALLARVQQSTGFPGTPGADLPSLVQNIWFKNLGAYPNIV
jgi:hypothetical protein